MKKSILLLLFVFTCTFAYAQDEGQELGKDGVPLGVEARSGKLVFQSKDGDFMWWLDSRLQIDGAMFFEDKNTLSNGSNIRRATLAWKVILWKNWQAEIDFDFAEGTEADRGVDARDMWIQYNFPTINLQLQVGNYKDVFGLERLNSSRLLTFLERSLPTNAFTLGRRLGASAHYYTDLWQVKAGIWGHEFGTRIDKGRRDEGYATSIRASIAPINKKGMNIHIGGAYSYKIPDQTSDVAANSIEIKSRDETSVFDPKLYHTGEITNVNYYNRFGGEFTAVFGPLYVQSEYMKTQVVRWYNAPKLNFDGAYVMATYMLTGETRSYFVDEGEVGPIEKPRSDTWGAWELKARYSMLNLNDDNLPTPAYGGKGSVMSFGFNWYPNQNIKIQLEYNMTDHDEHATSKGKFIGDDDFSMIQARFQVSL
jgi:phosphate-selective porin OprO and OprP